MLNKVVICGIDTSSLEVIPGAEMKELMKKIKAGDRQARDYFIEHDLRLVAHIIKKDYASYKEQEDSSSPPGARRMADW